MAIVKNKSKLLETSLVDFVVEKVNGDPFYSRYQEIGRLFQKYLPSIDFDRCFAQPYENKTKKVIEWYCLPGSESPCRLSDLKENDADTYTLATAKIKEIVAALQKVCSEVGEKERQYLNAALVGVNMPDALSTTYFYDGQILFGVWGMRAKQGRKIEDVIKEDVLDHRVFSIKYNLEGKGTLSFNSITRKFGRIIGALDVPRVNPSDGWRFVRWEPNVPQGTKVTGNIEFTAICERDMSSTTDDTISDDFVPDNDTAGNNFIEDNIPQDETMEYDVIFLPGEHGTLTGRTEYSKNDGEHIAPYEIPDVHPDEGYRFIGWDKEPENYAVHEDTTFTAQYERIEEDPDELNIEDAGPGGDTVDWKAWLSGILKTLLSLLLLALIGLLLWFLLGNHNLNFCGCDCDEETNVPPIHEEEENTEVIDTTTTTISACDELQYAGNNDPKNFIFDMGQPQGTFLFEYATGNNQADRIIIYDGDNRNANVIYDYYGTTGNCDLSDGEKVSLNFTHQKILVDVIPDSESGTCWEIKVHCPQK